MYQHLPLQGPAKFAQIGIFGLKICHLATLVSAWTSKFSSSFRICLGVSFEKKREGHGNKNFGKIGS
jgi:hypothetical protein